jgi:hypothetical protein
MAVELQAWFSNSVMMPTSAGCAMGVEVAVLTCVRLSYQYSSRELASFSNAFIYYSECHYYQLYCYDCELT